MSGAERLSRQWGWKGPGPGDLPFKPEALHHSGEKLGLSCTGSPCLAWYLRPSGNGRMDRRAPVLETAGSPLGTPRFLNLS